MIHLFDDRGDPRAVGLETFAVVLKHNVELKRNRVLDELRCPVGQQPGLLVG